jgi:hypothetical protein
MAYWGVLPIVPKMEPYLTLVNDFKLPSYTDHQSLFNAIIATVKLNQDERKKIIHPLYEWISNNRIHSKDNSRVNLYSNLLQNCPQKSDFFEDRNCGYNYLDKKENTEYSFINEIKNINKLIELNQIQQAHLQTLKMLEDNPLNPKVTLYYLNLIKKLKFPHDKEYLVLIKTTFQKDIQIQLNIIELNDTEDSKLESLYELISLIRLQCENYQKSVREILANYLIALIKSSNQKYETNFHLIYDWRWLKNIVNYLE